MAIPFSIQDTDEVIRAYGDNPQMIAQAAQMGVIDPTSAVLAVMKMQHERQAQFIGAGQQPTVAQQVLGGGGPPMPPAPQGLGAIPSPVPPSPPQMPAMEEPAPPVGMSMGGLTSLPIPDDMFDEPSNGGYANGGLVAFSDGGGIDAARLRAALRAQESGGDYGIMNAEGSGAMGAYQFMPDTARALAARIGEEYRPDLMRGKGGRSKEGRAYQERLMDEQMKDIMSFAGGDIGRAGVYHFAGPNEKLWGPKTRQYEKDILRRYTGGKDTGEIPERDTESASGRMSSLEDILATVQGINRKSPEEEEAEARVRARLNERASDEYYEEQRKADMWQTLAEIGFNMASSKSPFVLQAIGEAAAAAMPGARADKKDRKETKDRALEGLMELGARDRKEAMEGLKAAIPIWQAGMSAEEAERAMQFRERELTSREKQSELDRQATLLAATLREKNPDKFDRIISAVMAANPKMSELEAMLEAQKKGLLGGGQGGMLLPGDTGGASGMDLSKWGTPTVVTQ